MVRPFVKVDEEPTSPLTPLAPYPDVQRTRATEFYGFAALTGTSVLFVVYHVWALTPDNWIEATGVTWYPSREWSLLIPAYTIIIILLTYFTYWGLALSATPSFDELKTIIDSHAHFPKREGENPYMRQANLDALPELHDIPIGTVNRVLFTTTDAHVAREPAQQASNQDSLKQPYKAMSSVQAAKKLLRSNMKKTLSALSLEEIHNQSNCVFDQISSNPLFQNAAVVSCYLSMPTAELNTNDIVRLILREGKVLFVPKIDSSRGEIDMLRVYDEEDLKSLIPKKWGIREPELYRNGSLRANVLDASSPPLDLVLMPGVAFDKTFSRLGHGKGYYDRFLLNYNSIRTRNQQSSKAPELYALSFTEQILSSSVIPISDHDWQLDGIFHPEGVLMRLK